MRASYLNIKTIHILGWVSYFILLTISISSISEFSIAVYITTLTVTLHSILFYSNTLFLMPKLLDKNKYVLYFLSLIILIIAAVGILYLFNVQIKPFGDMVPSGKGFRPNANLDLSQHPRRRELSNSAIFTRSVMRNFSSVVAIILLSIVYRMFSQKLAKEKRETTVQNEHLISEMKFLKSQVNPHFLFNALNNIYTLVHLKHDNAPTMLMKLSDMLRYMLYECNDEWVPLDKEITYINNYIELQQLKTEQDQNIVTDFNNVDSTTTIPPLLLIPFIENSFKHSRIENTKTESVSIQLNSLGQQINFVITNSIPTTPIAKDNTGGIGLENVKRRLELLYYDNYELTIDDTKQKYTVTLNINNL